MRKKNVSQLSRPKELSEKEGKGLRTRKRFTRGNDKEENQEKKQRVFFSLSLEIAIKIVIIHH